ncbi:MAG: hypothetical protein ACRD5J_13080, partial [Nitrososphaeraceae archaeon]
MTKIGSNDNIVSDVSVKYPSLSLFNDLKCFVFVAFYIVVIAVASNQSAEITSLQAQGDVAEDNPLDDSNINVSSSMSQTNEPGDLGQENFSGNNTENQTSSPKLPILTEVSDKG